MRRAAGGVGAWEPQRQTGAAEHVRSRQAGRAPKVQLPIVLQRHNFVWSLTSARRHSLASSRLSSIHLRQSVGSGGGLVLHSAGVWSMMPSVQATGLDPVQCSQQLESFTPCSATNRHPSCNPAADRRPPLAVQPSHAAPQRA